jgi:hypothetical protein
VEDGEKLGFGTSGRQIRAQVEAEEGGQLCAFLLGEGREGWRGGLRARGTEARGCEERCAASIVHFHES